MAEQPKLAWSDAPGHVIVNLDNIEHGMTVEQATWLHQALFHATVQAVTDKHGRWAFENPNLEKDPT